MFARCFEDEKCKALNMSEWQRSGGHLAPGKWETSKLREKPSKVAELRVRKED